MEKIKDFFKSPKKTAILGLIVSILILLSLSVYFSPYSILHTPILHLRFQPCHYGPYRCLHASGVPPSLRHCFGLRPTKKKDNFHPTIEKVL